MQSPCLDRLAAVAAIANVLIGLFGVFLFGFLLWHWFVLLVWAGPSVWLLLGLMGAAAHAARTMARAQRPSCD